MGNVHVEIYCMFLLIPFCDLVSFLPLCLICRVHIAPSGWDLGWSVSVEPQ